MSDFIDEATDLSQLMLDIAIKNARANKYALPYTGACHNCRESVPSPAQFCDTDCRDDWTMRNRR